MVSEFKAVRDIVFSENYRKLLVELAAFLRINIDSDYEEVFARLDSAKMERAGLKKPEVECILIDDAESIKKYSINKHRALHGLSDEQEYRAGEEPTEDEKDVVLSVGNYAQGFLLTNIIEYVLAKEGAARLQEYLKLSRIPKAKEYAKQVLGWMVD